MAKFFMIENCKKKYYMLCYIIHSLEFQSVIHENIKKLYLRNFLSTFSSCVQCSQFVNGCMMQTFFCLTLIATSAHDHALLTNGSNSTVHTMLADLCMYIKR